MIGGLFATNSGVALWASLIAVLLALSAPLILLLLRLIHPVRPERSMPKAQSLLSGTSKAPASVAKTCSWTPEILPRLPLPQGLLEHPRYRIISEIGSGGMGTVYLAVHRVLKRTVALKVVNTSYRETVDRFMRESQALATLQHINIVNVLDAERVDGVPILVMEYLQGENLGSLVRRCGAQDVRFACNLIRQATEGVRHAHDRGVLHRDIKPPNLFLTKADVGNTTGVVKVLDFGLAKLLNIEGDRGITPQGFAMGTYGYMPPEQTLDARSVGVQADIFSLGRTLYYLLVGWSPSAYSDPSRPNGHDCVVPLSEAIEERRQTSSALLNNHRPKEVFELVDRMTAFRAEDRFDSCADVLEALDSISF